MIDNFRNKRCPLYEGLENEQCNNCVWLDKKIKICIFSINYPFHITIEELCKRAKLVDEKQQKKLLLPRRFVCD